MNARSSGPPPRSPRWVKVSAVILVVVVALAAALLLFGGGGEHGPGRHAASHEGVVAGSQPHGALVVGHA